MLYFVTVALKLIMLLLFAVVVAAAVLFPKLPEKMTKEYS